MMRMERRRWSGSRRRSDSSRSAKRRICASGVRSSCDTPETKSSRRRNSSCCRRSCTSATHTTPSVSENTARRSGRRERGTPPPPGPTARPAATSGRTDTRATSPASVPPGDSTTSPSPSTSWRYPPTLASSHPPWLAGRATTAAGERYTGAPACVVTSTATASRLVKPPRMGAGRSGVLPTTCASTGPAAPAASTAIPCAPFPAARYARRRRRPPAETGRAHAVSPPAPGSGAPGPRSPEKAPRTAASTQARSPGATPAIRTPAPDTANAPRTAPGSSAPARAATAARAAESGGGACDGGRWRAAAARRRPSASSARRVSSPAAKAAYPRRARSVERSSERAASRAWYASTPERPSIPRRSTTWKAEPGAMREERRAEATCASGGRAGTDLHPAKLHSGGDRVPASGVRVS